MRQTGGGREIEHQSADVGGELAGFEDDGIPGDEGWDDVPVGEMAGEIEWAEDGDDAVRFEARGGCAGGGLGNDGFAPLMVGRNGDGDFVDHRINFGKGFPAGFTDFLADCLGHLGAMSFQLLGETVDDVDAIVVGPGGEHCTGTGDGTVDVGGVRGS